MDETPSRDPAVVDKPDGFDRPDLLRALIDTLPDQVYVKDTESRYIVNNTKHARDLGAACPEEIAGKTDFDFYPRELAEQYRADEQEIVRSGRPLVYKEEPGVDEEGNERLHSTTKMPLRDRNGKILGLVGITRDVTGRKEAEEKLGESEKRFRALIQNASDVITISGADGAIYYDSPAIERVLDYYPEERLGKKALSYVHPNDKELVRNTFADALDNPAQVQRPVEFRIRHKDGSWRYMEVIRTNLLGDPAANGVVSNWRDITERKRSEEALKESEERFRTAFEDAPIGVALVGLDGCRTRVNHALCEMLGYAEEELRGKAYTEDVHPEDREASEERLNRLLEERSGSYTLERRYLHADGHVVWNLSSVSLVQDSQGNPSHLVCLHQDITGRKILEEHLEYQAFHDSLTRLPNRTLFLNRLEHAIARARRKGGSVAVLFLDLDDFKFVNDSLGHDAGNTLLIEVAERLQSSVRPGDTVGRIFGDEFAVLLEAPSGLEEACRVTERIEECLRAPLDLGGQEVFVNQSTGIALGDPTQGQPKDFLRHADLAMYEAKRKGKARYEVYNPSMDTRAAERMNLERYLRGAVEREEFEVHYQPIIELGTGKIEGIEALARWRHPERGLVAPSEFILLAEETGLIRPIGRWVMEEACRQAKEWRERYPDKALVMSVNLSANQFINQPDLAPDILDATGLDPGGLQLDITERAMMDDAEVSLSKLQKLKGLGIRFAIDDYGMGYSCLYYLKRMPVDSLKIDGTFISGLGEDPGDEAIVSGTIGLAHGLGLKVVAEGVETAGQLTRLKELGCDLAQGFHFTEPLASEAMSALLAKERLDLV